MIVAMTMTTMSQLSDAAGELFMQERCNMEVKEYFGYTCCSESALPLWSRIVCRISFHQSNFTCSCVRSFLSREAVFHDTQKAFVVPLTTVLRAFIIPLIACPSMY